MARRGVGDHGGTRPHRLGVAPARNQAGRDRTETIRRKLALLRDIRSTIERTGGNCVFDDIELFELKFFALLAEELRPLASQGHLAELPELNGVVDLLDPEGNRLPPFLRL